MVGSRLGSNAAPIYRQPPCPLLHQDDFETLVDLIFARGGWHRVSALGGNEADIDLAVEQSLTGERAFVQVKSGHRPRR